MFSAISRSRSTCRLLHSPQRPHYASLIYSQRFQSTNHPRNASPHQQQPSKENQNQDQSESTSSPSSSSSSSSSSSVPTLTLDFSPLDATTNAAHAPGRTGAKSSKGSLSSIEKRRRAYGRFASLMAGLGIAFGVFYLGRDWDFDEIRGKSKEELELGRWDRTKVRLGEATDVFSKPQWKELLPPPLPPPHGKPYTLLLSLDDLLITSVWDRKQGWRTAKRPGVDYFLAYLSQFYEVVIFTTQPPYTALPIIDSLDRYHYFLSYHLFREATRVIDGRITKDLSYLNRDLSKVIILDTHPDHIYTHPDNAILMKPWNGDSETGKGLVGLIPFLESIVFFNAPDVRPILRAYKDKDIALEYAKHEEREKQKFLQEWRQTGLKSSQVTSGGFFSSLFSKDPTRYTGPEPLTYLERKRREAQQFYVREQQYISDNREQLEKFRQDELDKQKEMAGSLVGWMQSMTGGPPPGAGVGGNEVSQQSKLEGEGTPK